MKTMTCEDYLFSLTNCYYFDSELEYMKRTRDFNYDALEKLFLQKAKQDAVILSDFNDWDGYKSFWELYECFSF